MGRLIHLEDARLGGAAHWWWAAVAVSAAAIGGFGLTWLLASRPAIDRGTAASPAPSVVAPQSSGQLAPMSAPTAAAAAGASTAQATVCPLQSMQLTIGGMATVSVCLDATRVHQNGSVRSYSVLAGGTDGWSLHFGVAGGEMVEAELAARDGRRYACAGSQCVGLSLGRHGTRGARTLNLHDLALAQTVGQAPADAAAQPGAAPGARISARLTVPADDHLPGLACTGPSIGITAADGSLQRFCGQGGAGFEIADDGSRNYRFQDHEGQTLMVSVSADQRVTAVQFGGYGCRGAACSGASMSSASPGNDFAERSFFFGRTTLAPAVVTAGPVQAGPPLIIDGSLVMPAQE